MNSDLDNLEDTDTATPKNPDLDITDVEDEEVVAEEIDISAAEAPVIVEPDLSFDSFEEAGLDPGLLAAINKLGWTKPTAIQSLCLPYTTAGKDLAGFAQTGTGKTGVFLISIAQQVLKMRALGTDHIKQPVAIVLSPTRELAMQIESDAQGLFETLGIRSLAVFGGVDYEKQARALQEGVDVVVATPGRLKDFAQKRVVNIGNCKIFVCDEADRMFDMGFIDDVKFFFDKLTEDTQRLLFSATTSPNVGELAFEYLNKPKYISATPESITPESIEQKAILCESGRKLQVMIGLLREHNPACAIVFTNMKITAEWLQFKLNGNGFESDLITGDLPQRKRIDLIKRIKAGQVKALIATDVASRGLHIAGVTHVYNFDLPDDASNYIHRVGRTARAGAKGLAVSLVCEDYGENLKAINDLLGPLAMKSEWYNSDYDNIKDEAGNPFPNRSSRPSQRRDGDQRGGRSGGRDHGQRRDRNAGGSGGQRRDRPQGGQDQRPRRDGQRHAQGQGGDQRPRQDGQRSQGGERGNQQRGGRGRGRDQQGRDRQQQRNRGEQPHEPRQQQPQRHQHQPQAAAKAAEAPKTFTGLVKKIFSTIFGAKSDKT